VLGFSAGGHLSAAKSTHFGERLYPIVDAADKESCCPDFALALYPGHLSIDRNPFELNPDFMVYYAALNKAGVPVEMPFVCTRRSCVWAATHEASSDGMASVVAGDDRDDFGVGARGSQTTNPAEIEEVLRRRELLREFWRQFFLQ